MPSPNVKGSNEAEKSRNYVAITAEITKSVRHVEFPQPLLWRFDPIPVHGLPLQGFAITLIGHATLGRTPLVERSSRHRDLYLITHNTQKRQTSMLPPRFELNPSKRAAADPRLRTRGHWDRHMLKFSTKFGSKKASQVESNISPNI